MSNKDDEKLADDILPGAAAIADYMLPGDEDPKKKRRKIYGLSDEEKAALGFFYIGKILCARKTTIRERIAAREQNAV